MAEPSDPASETRNSKNQFVPGVFHFRLPGAFRDPVFRPERTCHVVFDRDVLQRVRDEDLGRVRGQPIRPVLAVPDSLVPEFWGATAWSVWDKPRFCCRKKAQKPQKGSSFEPFAPFRGCSIRGPNQRLVSQGQARQAAADLAALLEGVEGIATATAEVTLALRQFNSRAFACVRGFPSSAR